MAKGKMKALEAMEDKLDKSDNKSKGKGKAKGNPFANAMKKAK